jgi:hypothetical protein
LRPPAAQGPPRRARQYAPDDGGKRRGRKIEINVNHFTLIRAAFAHYGRTICSLLPEMAMPDDLSSSAEFVEIDGQLPSSGDAATLGSSTGEREKSCDFGSCTFVTGWYQKINAQEGLAGKRTNSMIPDLQSETCPRCHGMFSSSTSLLPRIVLGATDKMGQTIGQVYLSGEDYTIYRTGQGVNVNFGDCRAREREQRARYEQISPQLCRLRFLTSQMARRFTISRFTKSGGFYDHQIAAAIYLALQGKSNEANEILNTGLALAEERVTNENRVRYLLACLLVGLIPAFVLWLLNRSGQMPLDEVWAPYLMAAAAGAAGAVFSIALRIQDLDLKPFAQSVMNYVMGALRVLTGFVAGTMILLIINGTVSGKGIAAVLTSPITELSAESWKCIVLIGFLGGFAERLVPSLLQTLQSRVENRVTKDQTNDAATNASTVMATSAIQR